MSIPVSRKKRGRPATGQDPTITVRLSDDLQGDLQKWIDEQPDPKPSRSEAIRRLLSDELIRMGLRKVQ